MRPSRPVLLKILIPVALLISIGAGYWTGYRAGFRAKGTELWAVAVVSPNGTNYTWFDVNNPREAQGLRDEENRLKSTGVNYFIVKGVVTTTTSAEDPRQVNSHR